MSDYNFSGAFAALIIAAVATGFLFGAMVTKLLL